MTSGRNHSDKFSYLRSLFIAIIPIFIAITAGCDSEANFSGSDREQALEDQGTGQDAEAVPVEINEPLETENNEEPVEEYTEEPEEKAPEPETIEDPEIVEEPEVIEASDAAAPLEEDVVVEEMPEEEVMESGDIVSDEPEIMEEPETTSDEVPTTEDEMMTEELSANISDEIAAIDPLKKKCGMTDQQTVALTLPSFVQVCLDQGLMYNFVTGACASKAPIDKNFACTMENIEAKMQELEIAQAEIDKLKADIDGGAKYFACSLRDAGNTLIVQHWKSELTPETTTCDSNFKTFLSGCYRKVFDPNLKSPETPEEIRAQVNSCMEDDL